MKSAWLQPILTMRIGFIGLGHIGAAMAKALVAPPRARLKPS
jgi:pyrroline-5-carboxylate reductase